MRGFSVRILKSVLPTSAVLAAFGFLFARAAGAYVSTDKDDAGELTAELSWKLPLAFAFWGGGMTLVFEFFRHLWGRNPEPAATAPVAADAEQLLLQLLEQAEAAEARRSGLIPTPNPVCPAMPTPPPRSEPLPLPEIDFPTPAPGR